MSGGSFNYAYSRLPENVSHAASTLEDMAHYVRGLIAHCKTKRLPPKYDEIPLTGEDFNVLEKKAMILEKAAAKIRICANETETLKDLMHDVEWIKSGDNGIECLLDP